MTRSRLLNLFVALGLGAACAQGNPLYYKDVLIGERASGLGGAFVAISDDPSGIFHNPAGIAFGLESYLNISANAFNAGSQTYQNIYPGQDYVYKSQSFIPTFFGFTQTIGKGKFGLAVVVPNSDDIDQDDRADRPAEPGVEPRSFIRKVSKQDISYMVGPAYAQEIAPNLSVGASFFGVWRAFKFIDNTLVLYDPVGTGKYNLHLASFNQSTFAGVLKLGLEWMPLPKWSFGLALTKNYNFGGSGRSRIIDTKVDGNGAPVTPDGTLPHDVDLQEYDNVYFAPPVNYSVSLGSAFFYSKELLFIAQLDYHSPQSTYSEYPLDVTLNWSVGSEYFLDDWVAVRLGLFSNNANSRPVVDGAMNQEAKVDQIGGTFATSFYRSGTSVTLGIVYSKGIGRGQAFSNSTLVQRVVQTNLGVYFAGSYQL
jgi:long-chain fatty acid transport protein